MLQNHAELFPGRIGGNREISENGDILVLRLGNLKNNGELTLSHDEKFAQLDRINPRQIIQKGDILMVIQGPLERIGNMYQFNLPYYAIAKDSLLVIRPNESPEELYNLLKNRYYFIKTLATTNTIIPRVTIQQLRELEL
jgi:hypothetical protein